MVLVLGVLVGVVVGLLLGGSLSALADLQLRGLPLFGVAITLQVLAYPSGVLPWHVADTVANRPRERVDGFRRFVRTGDLAIPRACGATWLLVDRQRFSRLVSKTAPVYRDERWALYRL